MTDNTNNGGQNAGGQGGSEGNAEPKLHRPEGLPDHLAGANNQETIDKLYGAYAGARETISKAGEVPAKPEEYTLDLADDIKAKLLKPGEDGVDPMLSKFQHIAHEFGVSKKAFNGMIGKLYETFAEQMAEQEKNAPPPLDFDYKDMGGADKAKPTVDAVTAWANGLKASGKLDDGDLQEIQLLSLHTPGLRVLSKLREMTGEKPIPANLDGKGGGAALTEADLNKRVSDPRYRKGTKDFDQKFYDETTEMFQSFYAQA